LSLKSFVRRTVGKRFWAAIGLAGTAAGGFSCPARAANVLDVVINEIAWAGTPASSSDEWIELYNNTAADVNLAGWTLRAQDGTPSIVLAGTVAARGYFLLERTDDAAVSDIPADQIFTGAVANGPPAEDFVLTDASSQTIDQVLFSTAGWPAGEASPTYRTLERISPARPGSLTSNWGSNNTVRRNGRAADGSLINGTPRAENSIFTLSASTPVYTPKVVEVDGTRNPFSPYDPDSAFRAGRIFFNVVSADIVKTVRVADARGETVRVLINHDRGPDNVSLTGTASGSVSWDGRDDHGALAPLGIYVVFLEGTDPATGERIAGRDTVVMGR
jgi:hypothetical protein